MKRINFFGATLCSAMLMATVSCSNNDLADDSATSNNGKVMMTATATSGSNNTQSRVAFGGNDGLTLNWEATDQIAVKVDGAETSLLTLKSGDGSTNATFEGEVTLPATTPTTITACYPSKAFEGTDLTAQTGEQADAAHNLVMFASAEYAYNPSFSFNNKVSVLKLNMDAPSEATTVKKIVIYGAYAKGTLSTDGTWSEPTVADITLSAAKIEGGKIVGYAVVIPGTPVKDLNIVVYTDNGNYITEAYTSETAKIENNQVIEINKALVKVTTYTAANYYQWDANLPYQDGSGEWNETTPWFNPTITDAASKSCVSCPTIVQIKMYIGAGVYWDNGDVGENRQSYIAPNDTICHAGLWMKKKVYIDGFDDNTANSVSMIDSNSPLFHNSRPAASEIDKYFFLPAAGRYFYGNFDNANIAGHYWSSTPDEVGSSDISFLHFRNDLVNIGYDDRDKGFLPMVAE